MTSFIHSDFPTTHLGVSRVEAAIDSLRDIAGRFRGAKGLVALLLAGAFSALVVVADQVVSSWADGQVVLAWMGLWVVLFAAVALFAEASRGWSESAAGAIGKWSTDHAQRLEDERTWRFAQADARFMSDLQVARCRAEREALAAGEPAPAWPFRNMPTHVSTRGFMG
jgi:hypothetical protein